MRIQRNMMDVADRVFAVVSFFTGTVCFLMPTVLYFWFEGWRNVRVDCFLASLMMGVVLLLISVGIVGMLAGWLEDLCCRLGGRRR